MTRRWTHVLLGIALCSCGEQGHKSEKTLTAKQSDVAVRGAAVMPFDLDRTMHHFMKMPAGGIQQVRSMDHDPRQIKLIRQHVKDEADRFQHGNFLDPASIHGADMPGLSTMSAGAQHIRVSYSDLPDGAQLSYAADDPKLVKAIHSWFDAQVREHGRHAMGS